MSNYAAWPILSDIEIMLRSLGVVPSFTGYELSVRVQQISDQVTAEVARRTGRQFVADTADSVRTYDGTGTAELEIDEFISFSGAVAAGLQADPGYGLDNVVAVVEQNKPMTRLVRGVGSLPAFPVTSVYQPVPTIFPAGRQNILVTATFGYAATISGDLWQAVCAEITRRIVSEAVFSNSQGRSELKEGDIGTTWLPSSAIGADIAAQYKSVVELYKRPSGRMLRNLRPRMI